MRKIRKGKRQRERKGEEKKKRRRKGRGMIALRGYILGGHENVSNFCFARFARANESTVLNGKKKSSWAGVCAILGWRLGPRAETSAELETTLETRFGWKVGFGWLVGFG
jgi:hypothetical protein